MGDKQNLKQDRREEQESSHISQIFHILKSSPSLPTKSPYQYWKNRMNWRGKIQEIMGGRVATLCNPKRPPWTSLPWGMVPSGLEQYPVCIAGHGGTGEIRMLARWGFFYTCSESRENPRGKKNSNNHSQLPQSIFKLKINLFDRLF